MRRLDQLIDFIRLGIARCLVPSKQLTAVCNSPIVYTMENLHRQIVYLLCELCATDTMNETNNDKQTLFTDGKLTNY